MITDNVFSFDKDGVIRMHDGDWYHYNKTELFEKKLSDQQKGDRAMAEFAKDIADGKVFRKDDKRFNPGR